MKELSPTAFRVLTMISAGTALCGPAMNAAFLPSISMAQTALRIPSEGAPYLLALEVANLLVGLASTAGLLFFRRWARTANLVSAAVGVGLYAMASYFIDSGPKVATDAVSLLTGGAVLALAYFSPMARRFELRAERMALHCVPTLFEQDNARRVSSYRERDTDFS